MLGLLLFGFQFSVHAGNALTPGAIASLLQPPGTRFEYDPVSDLSIFTRGQQTRFTLSVLPSIDPSFALQTLLTAFEAQQFISRIEAATIAGYPAASVAVKQQTSDWWMVIKLADLNLFVRVQDLENATAHRADVDRLVGSVRFAPASYPALVSGRYVTDSDYNDSYDNSLGVYTESGISLQPDGSFSSSGYVGISGADVTGYSQGEGPGGWWQVRGNRILAYEPPDVFYNYRFEAFSNGLEVYTDSNEKLLWTRN